MFSSLSKFYNFIFLSLLVLLQFNFYAFNTNINQRFYTNTSAMNSLRFRDFEPRYTTRSDVDLKPLIHDRLLRNIARNPRGFQFHANDEDFNVELEFIIPLIAIPIERSMTVTQTAFRSLFNLNLHSLLTTGAIVAIGGIFAIILKGFFTQFVYISNYKKLSRNGDAKLSDPILLEEMYARNATENVGDLNKFVSIMESKLKENNINIRHCIQRYLCSYSQEYICNAKLPKQGVSSIMEGVLSLDFVHNYLSGTAVKDSLDSAMNGDNCYEVYSDCNLSFPMKYILNLFDKNFSFSNIT